MGRKPIQDKFTYLYDELQSKGRARVARIIYELRRLDKGLCIWPGCLDLHREDERYCGYHKGKMRKNEERQRQRIAERKKQWRIRRGYQS